VPILRLTDLGLLNLVPPPKLTDFWDATLPTFGVRVSPKGTKTFVLKLRTGRQAIGRYPIITLAEARNEAKRILAERTLGKIRPTSITYPQAVRLFIEDKKQSSRPTTADQYEWFLGRLNFTCQLADIHPDDLERALKRIKSKSTYDHVLVAVRILFNWAMKRRYISHNPTIGITRPQSPPRARTLSDDELKLVWEASGKLGNFGVIVRLLVVTGQRRGEIAALQTSWISSSLSHTPPSSSASSSGSHQQFGAASSDLWTITIPASVTKNGREHTFPIGSISKSILENHSKSQHTFLFPARNFSKSATTFNGWSKSKAALDKLSHVEHWTLHDLRRTFATKLADLRTPPHVIERLLNHASGTISGVAAVYNRATYMPEMRAAIEAYEAHLKTILNLPA